MKSLLVLVFIAGILACRAADHVGPAAPPFTRADLEVVVDTRGHFTTLAHPEPLTHKSRHVSLDLVADKLVEMGLQIQALSAELQSLRPANSTTPAVFNPLLHYHSDGQLKSFSLGEALAKVANQTMHNREVLQWSAAGMDSLVYKARGFLLSLRAEEVNDVVIRCWIAATRLWAQTTGATLPNSDKLLTAFQSVVDSLVATADWTTTDLRQLILTLRNAE